MTKYELYSKEQREAQDRLNRFMEKHEQIIARYAQLINEHMAATNKANKAMIEEDIIKNQSNG